jgi:hypothetical protein
MSITEKTCSRCHEVLPIERFAIKRYKDGKPRWWQASCRQCVRLDDRARQEQRERNKGTVLGEQQVRLPVEPIAELVARHVAEFGEVLAAERFGIPPRAIWRLRNREFPTVGLDYVDKMLCVANMPGVLMELYPELYPDEGQVAA